MVGWLRLVAGNWQLVTGRVSFELEIATLQFRCLCLCLCLFLSPCLLFITHIHAPQFPDLGN